MPAPPRGVGESPQTRGGSRGESPAQPGWSGAEQSRAAVKSCGLPPGAIKRRPCSSLLSFRSKLHLTSRSFQVRREEERNQLVEREICSQAKLKKKKKKSVDYSINWGDRFSRLGGWGRGASLLPAAGHEQAAAAQPQPPRPEAARATLLARPQREERPLAPLDPFVPPGPAALSRPAGARPFPSGLPPNDPPRPLRLRLDRPARR